MTLMRSSAAWRYSTRIAPVLTVSCLVAVLSLSLLFNAPQDIDDPESPTRATFWQSLMSFHLCILSLSSVVFPARALRALNHVIRRTKVTVPRLTPKPTSLHDERPRDNDTSRLNSYPLFVIIIPAYREDSAVLEETLSTLAEHHRAGTNYHIYLAMEERETGAEKKAGDLLLSFENSFFRIEYCSHPHGLPGEVPGKSSNQSWAANLASRFYSAGPKDSIIVTVMDADTHLFPQYFDRIAEIHAARPTSRHRTIYMPPLIFDRNISDVPLLVRLADILWAGAGISSMYPGSKVCIPTGVYSLPMLLIDHVGGWDTNADAIGEDMHMYLKCFFAVAGNLNSEVIFAPASQCNICSSDAGIRGYADNLWLRYEQALRHMWGALDTGYAIRKFVHAIRNKHHFDEAVMGESSSTSLFESGRINSGSMIKVFYRLFEAHLLPTHLGLTLVTASYHAVLFQRSSTPPCLQVALNISAWCRSIGFVLMMCFFWRYQYYHEMCVKMRRTRLAGSRNRVVGQESIKIFHYAGVAEAIIFPIGGIIYGIVPALQAMISHIFTDQLQYVVSLKTTRKSDKNVELENLFV